MASRGNASRKPRSHRRTATPPAVPQLPMATRGRGGSEGAHRPGLLMLSIGALGVVFGDIGTSPIYAFRESFLGKNPVPPSISNVLGVLSLVFWTLTIIISVKYLIFVLRLDNNGEGGILALTFLLRPGKGNHRGKTSFRILTVLGIFGACLLYGDGMITPAISVLSAIEGLKIALPSLAPYIVSITVGVLVLLFVFQRAGTAGVGAVFGPVMLVWFFTIAILGAIWIVREPQVLAAVNPVHAVDFFVENGGRGFTILGSVVLVVTGGEALYADLGHFGKHPIRISWFALVFPSLLLNYFGQGAQLLSHPGTAEHPFFNLAPGWAVIPLVILATVATVIASQAVISGAFSLTRQASLLRIFPPVHIVQTSEEEIGQIYVPMVNWILMFATIGLVLGFRSSSNLAGAYGVAVTTTMVITTILANVVVRQWGIWKPAFVWVLTGMLLLVDLSFFGANILKVVAGGWFPLTVAAVAYGLMSTWRKGREHLAYQTTQSQPPLDQFLRKLGKDLPVRVPGTGVFLSHSRDTTPIILTHHLKHNQVLHKQVVLLTLAVEPKPFVSPGEALEFQSLSHGVERVVYHYGFMQQLNIPRVLEASARNGLKINFEEVTYYLRRQTVIPSPEVKGMAIWREKLFAFMARNSAPSASFYHIPAEQVVELGVEVEI